MNITWHGRFGRVRLKGGVGLCAASLALLAIPATVLAATPSGGTQRITASTGVGAPVIDSPVAATCTSTPKSCSIPIYGSGFSGSSWTVFSVSIGGVSPTSFEVVSPTEILTIWSSEPRGTTIEVGLTTGQSFTADIEVVLAKYGPPPPSPSATPSVTMSPFPVPPSQFVGPTPTPSIYYPTPPATPPPSLKTLPTPSSSPSPQPTIHPSSGGGTPPGGGGNIFTAVGGGIAHVVGGALQGVASIVGHHLVTFSFMILFLLLIGIAILFLSRRRPKKGRQLRHGHVVL